MQVFQYLIGTQEYPEILVSEIGWLQESTSIICSSGNHVCKRIILPLKIMFQPPKQPRTRFHQKGSFLLKRRAPKHYHLYHLQNNQTISSI